MARSLTAAEARRLWLEHLAGERRASPRTLEAYGFAAARYIAFLEQHRGEALMVRVAIWEPAREGLLAFGSADPEGFTPDMGSELVAFLARVVERTAERWPGA